MTERESLPALITAQAVVVRSEQRGSLVGRGLAALRKGNDAFYRQARTEFDEDYFLSWNENEYPNMLSVFKIFQQLAIENYGKAYYPLAILYGGKFGGKEDQDRAQHYAQMAVDWCLANQANQDVEVWCDLGEMYSLGTGVEKNDEQAVYWYLKAAEHGDPHGQWRLAQIYAGIGTGVALNKEQARYWYLKAAEQGEAKWKFLIALFYSSGDIFEKNKEQTAYWYLKAAEQDNSYSQEALKELDIDWEK